LEMQSSKEFKEVRFKVRDSTFQVYCEMALYCFDMKIIDKPTIHEYARWCMKQITDINVANMLQWKLIRSQQTQVQQNTMFGNQQDFNQVFREPIS
jgi:hypothetical protein